MIFVDLDDLALPDGWITKAKAARAEVAAIADVSLRRDKIRSLGAIWRELIVHLRTLSNSKCWYCECDDVRSDLSVDHFRPKGAVTECVDHSGYWWLAFDQTNFRLCCTWCNSRRIDRESDTVGGKQTCFPLVMETSRAYTPDDDLLAELPMLLDPTVPSDPPLIWFDEFGRASPRFDASQNAIAFARAEASIDLFHLNSSRVLASRSDLCSAVARHVERTDAMWARRAKDPSAIRASEDAMRDLLRLARRSKRFSAAARCVLLSRRDLVWIESVLAQLS